jgi:hypothetical protein
MRGPFKEANARLVAEGYKHGDHWVDEPVVFGGRFVYLTYSTGGSYSDNGGRHYSPAMCSPRLTTKGLTQDQGEAAQKAFRAAAEADKPAYEALREAPRTNAAAEAILRAAEALDVRVAELYPPMLEQVMAEKADIVRRRRAAEIGQAISKLASGRLLEEVLRLDAEVLLDDSNALKGLKDIVDELRAIQGGVQQLEQPAGATIKI